MARFSRRTLALAGALALGCLGLAAPAQAQTTLKWAHVYEISEPYHTWAVWAGDEIAKRTEGRYKVEVFPASSLGKESDINEGLGLGTVDIIYTGQLFAGRFYGPIAIGGAPFVFRDYDHWAKFRTSDLFGELAGGYEQTTGNHIVTLTYYGERQTTSNREILKPEDMAGLNIRVPDAPLYKMFPEAVGANPTPIAFAEVYLALQNGTVEAQENPLTTIEAKKFYEVQKYIVLTGHIVDHLNTVLSKSLWAKLSDEDRQIFTDVAQEAAERASKQIQAREVELVGFFKDKGLEVTEVDTAGFKEAVAKNVTFEKFGYRKEDWDRIQAVKSGS